MAVAQKNMEFQNGLLVSEHMETKNCEMPTGMRLSTGASSRKGPKVGEASKSEVEDKCTSMSGILYLRERTSRAAIWSAGRQASASNFGETSVSVTAWCSKLALLTGRMSSELVKPAHAQSATLQHAVSACEETQIVGCVAQRLRDTTMAVSICLRASYANACSQIWR